MKPRHAYRLAEKVRAAAALCGVALSEWVMLPREERKTRIRKARRRQRVATRTKGAGRG